MGDWRGGTRTAAGNFKATADNRHYRGHLARVERLLTKAGMTVLHIRPGEAYNFVATSDAEVRLIQVVCGCGRLIEGRTVDPHDIVVPSGIRVFREIWTVRSTWRGGSTLVRTVRL